MRFGLLTLAVLAAASTPVPAGDPAVADLPRRYVCYRAPEPPVIDGRLAEASWLAAPWTAEFVDIEGAGRPAPRLRTRARMLWDDRFFYVGAELEEPHVWATLTERDSVIFHDNDFEVFIDPDGDTHLYYELELNALGTDWDLLLVKPYRDGGPPIQRWDIAGLQTEAHVDGTINDPADQDRGWSVEIAIPWPVLSEGAGRPCPPRAGDRWWVNFSRVEWRTHVTAGAYVKDRDPQTGKVLPENNWVWSPQGVIDMHRPETWGLVQFSNLAAGAGVEEFVPLEDLTARMVLRDVYHRQRARSSDHGAFATDVAELGIEDPRLDGWQWPPEMYCTPELFHAILRHADGSRLQITQDGRIWRERE